MTSHEAPSPLRDRCIGMTRPEQIRQLETEGFLVMENAISASDIAALKAEFETLPMRPSFFTDKPAFAKVPPHTHGPEAARLIGNEKVLSFARDLMGPELVFMHSFYILSHPGAPELDYHTDFQPFGSTYSQWLESCPLRLRVLYYLDDTGEDRSALKIVPRSHICWHSDAQPYRRYNRMPHAVTLPLKAGDAFIFATRLFHGVGPNTTEQTRGMIEIDYRPLWARPYGPVPNWSSEQLQHVPSELLPMVADRNRFDFHWEFDTERKGVDDDAPGLSPERWGD
ncbi:phytanoyl-CoA dioxygenase family protein [Croceicoccus sp. Ery5]|uniref:phytanoyl-CoA dioxygenase family protein n=1 Tax=Croceicoccus sp. Ery5 TaxID=1703340 RepID=UPI001E4F5495|nr:phytanoyl-CoA dioxygenase family protein [Croceicoccus sp. Ery5]